MEPCEPVATGALAMNSGHGGGDSLLPLNRHRVPRPPLSFFPPRRGRAAAAVRLLLQVVSLSTAHVQEELALGCCQNLTAVDARCWA